MTEHERELSDEDMRRVRESIAYIERDGNAEVAEPLSRLLAEHQRLTAELAVRARQNQALEMRDGQLVAINAAAEDERDAARSQLAAVTAELAKCNPVDRWHAREMTAAIARADGAEGARDDARSKLEQARREVEALEHVRALAYEVCRTWNTRGQDGGIGFEAAMEHDAKLLTDAARNPTPSTGEKS